jgi:hypothetical protein
MVASMTKIEINPVKQTGHNCKITAIAAVDAYFANLVNFAPIPLHKNKTSAISIRQISKTKGSLQGELLEARQLSEIFTDLGYKTQVVDFVNNREIFETTVKETIQSGNLIIACFAAKRNSEGGVSLYYENNEHAAILHGFGEINENDKSTRLFITHWDKEQVTYFKDFFNSCMQLPETRNPEYYVNIKNYDKKKKYDLVKKIAPNDPRYRTSLRPTKTSGFRGKLFVIKRPELENIREARNHLTQLHHLATLFKELKLKTDALSKNKYINSPDLISHVNRLNTELKKYCEAPLSTNKDQLVGLKTVCESFISVAKPQFLKHRGWHSINRILRIILGVLAALTVIPGLAVAIGTKHGFVGSFFKTPRTDSEEKLAAFEQHVNKLIT